MKKQITLLAAVLAAAALAGGTAVKADAAVKENTVADNLITESGILNEADWSFSSQEIYRNNAGGSYIRFKDVAWGAGYVQPYNRIDFSKGDGVFEFDISGYKNGSIRPLFHNGLAGAYTTIWIGGDSIDCTVTAGLADRIELFADYECTTPYSAPRPNIGAWFNAMSGFGNYGKHFKLTYKADGTLGVETFIINADGTTAASEKIFIKNAYTEVNASELQYVGINAFGTMNIDNLKVTNGTEVIQENDCTGTDWVNTDGVPSENKVLLMGGGITVAKESSLDIIAPADTDRIVSEEPIRVDENVSTAFVLTGEMKVKELGKNFGFAFGLAGQSTPVSESSYVYICNRDGVTYLASNGTGEAVALGKDLAALDEYVEFSFTGTKDGKVSATIDGVTAEFADMKIDGYVAVLTEGEGTVNVSLSSDMKLKGYKYRASAGGTIANNFNTGYINPGYWSVTTGKALAFVDPEKAEGIVTEDGALFFKGTTFGAWFGTTDSYADFVLEFDYVSIATDSRPAVQESWPTGHSNMVVIIGGTQGSGWGNGLMCEFKESANRVQFHNFKDSPATYPAGTGSFDFKAGADTDKTTAVKIVAAGNNVKIYVQDITSASFDKANYVLLAETDVSDTYGTVAFASDDCGYFKLDNIRITPIDDPDPEKEAEKLAAYEDKALIADEYRPYELAAPVLSLSENVVSWAPVEGATGYEVTVNGVTSEIQTETSYAIEATEKGNYAVTVKAIGNGDYIYDSEPSETVTYTIGGGSSDSGTSEETSSSEKDSVSSGTETSADGGCGSAAGFGAVAAICVFAAAAVIGKRRY